MKKLIALLVTGLMLLSMTACSTGSTGTTTTSPAAASAPDSSASSSASAASAASTSPVGDVMSEVKAQLADYSGKPKFYAADYGTVDAKATMSGKKVFLIPYDATNPFSTNIAQKESDLLKFLGADVFIYNGDGTAESWSTGIQTAVNQKYDAIDIIGGASVETLESQIKEAQAAGVYVQDTHDTDIHEKYNDDYTIGADLTHNGELIALETIREAGDVSKLNCLVVADVGITADNYMRKGITSVFDKYGVKYTIKEVAITDWTTRIAEQVRTALVADSSINAVVAYYDYMMLYVIPAMQEMSVDFTKYIVGSYNGSPALLDYITAGTMDFDVGESVSWTACHGVDCMIRAFAKQKVYNTAGFASYIINSSNVASCVDPKTGKGSYAYDGVSDIYLPGYSKLWGIDLTGVFK